MTDSKRLDWLEENGFGAALINDDNGHWTVAFSGMQNVPEGNSPIDIMTSHFIEKGKWRKNIRDAIDAVIAEHETPKKEKKKTSTNTTLKKGSKRL